MVLAARPVHFPAYAPIDESTRPELLELGQAVLRAENVRPTENGGYETRRGFTAQPVTRIDGTSRSAAYKVFAHDKQTCVVAEGPTLDAYSTGVSNGAARGRLPETAARVTGLPCPSSSAYVYDVAVAGSYLAVAYGTSYAATNKLAIMDAQTGAVLRSPETIGSGNGLVVVGSYGRYFIAFVYTTSSTAIDAYILDTNALGSGWTLLAAVAASTGGALPSVCSLSDRVAVAYGLGAGANRAAVKTYDASGLLRSVALGNATTPATITIDGSTTGNLWVAWDGGTVAHVHVLDPTTLATTGAPGGAFSFSTGSQNIGICEGVGNTARLFVFTTNATPQLQMCNLSVSGGLLSATPHVIVYNAAPVSRPFRHGSRFYMAVAPSPTATTLDGNTQALCVFVDWTDDVSYMRPVANVMPGLVPNEAVFCKVVPVSATKYLYGLQTLRSGKGDIVSLSLGNGTVGCSIVEVDFASTQRWTTTHHGNCTFLGGGLLGAFDGERVTEVGFLCAPTQPTGALSGTGLNGTYRAVAVYEDVDANGNWHISGVSLPSAAVVAANQTITWSTRPLTVSSRTSKGTTRVAFYRTAAGGEPPYYRLAATTNDTSLSAITYADSVADTSLTARAKLYAPSLPGVNGGAQDRRAPPGLLFPTSYNGMLVGAEGENLWYSGQDVYGEGTWFNPIFQVPVSGDGAITALATQDGTLYVFKRRAIYAIAGEQPADNGAAGGLGVPQRLAVDVGCIDARSIVVTSLGIFFQSERGIEILTRAQSVEPIGEKVTDTLGSYPICSAATLDPIRDVVYFELAASAAGGVVTGNGRTLIFDLTLKAWISTDRRPSYSGTADTPAQSACMIWDGSAYRYAWLETGGRVRPEQSAYYDRGASDSFIVPLVEYPPFKLGLQQRMRTWRAVMLVEQYSACGFKVEHLWDWATSYSASDDKTWTEAQALSKRQLYWNLKTGEHQSVRFRISATAPATLGTGRGLALIGFSLDVAPKQGSSKGTPNLDPAGRK